MCVRCQCSRQKRGRVVQRSGGPVPETNAEGREADKRQGLAVEQACIQYRIQDGRRALPPICRQGATLGGEYEIRNPAPGTVWRALRRMVFQAVPGMVRQAIGQTVSRTFRGTIWRAVSRRAPSVVSRAPCRVPWQALRRSVRRMVLRIVWSVARRIILRIALEIVRRIAARPESRAGR